MIRARALTSPSAHLLSIETLRKQCEVSTVDVDSDGVESHPDDALLLVYLDAAVDHAEEFTGLAIGLREYEAAIDKFPDGDIELPRPPLVELIAFTLSDDSDGEVSSADYVLDQYGNAAALRTVTSWPSVIQAPNAVKVRFRAGYSSEVEPDSDAETLPGAIKAAILLTVGHLYANREASIDKAMSELPLGVNALLRPKRVRTGMA